MSTLADRRTVGEVVTRIYTAAGRKATELELRLYAEVLAGVDAELATEASIRMVAAEDWRWRPPSPALLLEYVRAARTDQRNRRPAIAPDTGPPAPAEVSRSHIAEVRAKYGLGHRRAPVPAEQRSIRATAHDLDDHQFCPPDCSTEEQP